MEVKHLFLVAVLGLPISIGLLEYRLRSQNKAIEVKAQASAEKRMKQRFERRFSSRMDSASENQWAHGRRLEDLIAEDRVRYEGIAVEASYKPMQKLEQRRRSFSDKLRKRGATTSANSIRRMRDDQVQALLVRSQSIDSVGDRPSAEEIERARRGRGAAW